jgi:hypothetical protein
LLYTLYSLDSKLLVSIEDLKTSCCWEEREKRELGRQCTPLRLLDCFGFVTPEGVLEAPEDCLAVVDLRFCDVILLEGGSLADWTTGEDRKADGDGMVIVSILSQSNVDTLIPALRAETEG